MLYKVPHNMNDDLFWIYSTIYEGRKSQAFVVTNDYMRDHKLQFLAPIPFQIVYYSVNRPILFPSKAIEVPEADEEPPLNNTLMPHESNDSQITTDLDEDFNNKLPSNEIKKEFRGLERFFSLAMKGFNNTTSSSHKSSYSSDLDEVDDEAFDAPTINIPTAPYSSNNNKTAFLTSKQINNIVHRNEMDITGEVKFHYPGKSLAMSLSVSKALI